MPENPCRLVFGPWQARFESVPADAGPFYTASIPAPGGETTRIVTWSDLEIHPATQTACAAGREEPIDVTLRFADLTLVVSTPDVDEDSHDTVAAVPLALLAPVDNEWVIYLPIRMDGDNGLFMRVDAMPAEPGTGPPELHAVIHRLPALAENAGSHECWYFKHDENIEYEHKFTLEPDTDIYTLARQVRNNVGLGELRRYRWEYRDDWQTWQFDNYLFDVTGPLESDCGYASFIPKLGGGHIIKRKIYPEDGFRRTELKSLCPQPLPTVADKAAHLRDALDLEVTYLGRFRRIRFDVQLENIDTGHIHSIMIDRCTFPDYDPTILQQLEVEYLRSRGTARDCEAEICDELDELKTWSRSLLEQLGIGADEQYMSKATFLQQLSQRHASGAAARSDRPF